jgi:hypothetical protein
MSGRRLAIYLGSAVLIYILVIFVIKPLLPPDQEAINLRLVKEHIGKITPAWNSFRRTNDGYQLVSFRVYTGNGGLLEVNGYLTSNKVAPLLNFLSETHPPRPLQTNLHVVPPDHFEIFLADETNGPTNLGAVPQPTNR